MGAYIPPADPISDEQLESLRRTLDHHADMINVSDPSSPLFHVKVLTMSVSITTLRELVAAIDDARRIASYWQSVAETAGPTPAPYPDSEA